MAPPTQEDLEQLHLELAETLDAIERVRAALRGAEGRNVDAGVALPEVVRDDRPGESIPLLEQQAADLRRDIKVMEVELARSR